MTDWPLLDSEWPLDRLYDPYAYALHTPLAPYFCEMPPPPDSYTSHAQLMPPNSPALPMMFSSSPERPSVPTQAPTYNECTAPPKRDNPRESRNQAEKQRRDKFSRSISDLAAIVPPVVAANRKVDKTGILRLTAHYLRAHQYVFGDSIGRDPQDISTGATQSILSMLRGFLLTTTYKGLVVVASQNVQQYLGYSELDLLGQNIFNMIHPDDKDMLKAELTPNSELLGTNGELLFPEEPDGDIKIAKALANDKRRFIIRFKKLSQRSEPNQYLSCCVEGVFRKSDKARRGYMRCCQTIRRVRARGDNPHSSGNDIVFVAVVRPVTETFMSESNMEAFKLEYRTRHSIDGEIIQTEQRIALVTGYMTHEVNGINAMNFMHRDDVHWVIFALREMYDQRRMVGESCYRLMTKNGQFIYLRTLGRLDVDEDSRAVRSFVCINTLVEETEGKHLIQKMKKKFMLTVKNNEKLLRGENKEINEDSVVPVEDPRQLEKVILHLVTNLPSPQSEEIHSDTSERGESPSFSLAIIPPRKERIVSAIEKIYSVIKIVQKQPKPAIMDPSKPVEPSVDSTHSSELVSLKPTLTSVTTTTSVSPNTTSTITSASNSPSHIVLTDLNNQPSRQQAAGYSCVSNIFPEMYHHPIDESYATSDYSPTSTDSNIPIGSRATVFGHSIPLLQLSHQPQINQRSVLYLRPPGYRMSLPVTRGATPSLLPTTPEQFIPIHRHSVMPYQQPAARAPQPLYQPQAKPFQMYLDTGTQLSQESQPSSSSLKIEQLGESECPGQQVTSHQQVLGRQPEQPIHARLEYRVIIEAVNNNKNTLIQKQVAETTNEAGATASFTGQKRPLETAAEEPVVTKKKTNQSSAIEDPKDETLFQLFDENIFNIQMPPVNPESLARAIEEIPNLVMDQDLASLLGEEETTGGQPEPTQEE